MKKIKIKEITIFLIIMLYLASGIMLREVKDLDELWNYNFASNISNGLIPYKDFNMVVTPLLSMVSGIILSIFGKQLIIIRMLNILLNTLIIFMTYKIMQKLEVKKYITYAILMFSTYVIQKYAMFDYNFAIELIILIIVYLEIGSKKTSPIVLGILAGLCITLKQTIGLAVSVVLIGYKLLEVRNKEDLKRYAKDAMLRTIGAIIPVILMILYLVINGAFKDFIDYCIFGVSTFLNKVSYIQRLIIKSEIEIKILAVLPISIIILLIMYVKNKEKDTLILSIFGITSMLAVYPIADETHLMSGISITLIAVAYILNKIIKKDFIVLNIFLYVFSIMFVIYQVINSSYIYIKSNKNMNIEHYKYLIIKQNTIDYVGEIDKYIEESKKEVYILDSSAAFYMIPINRYHKDYDMFNLGNLGSKGEDGQIENIKQQVGYVKILIKKNKYSRNWQTPENVRKWIKQNMKKTDEVGAFEVYE